MRILSVLLLAVALVACGGGPKKRVFPPEARIQELQLAGGELRLQLRVHNYSNVPMRLDRVDLRLTLDEVDAGTLSLSPALLLAANSVELLDVPLPAASARAPVEQALAGGRSLRYRLAGTLSTSDPRGSYPVDFASRLDRVPGLDGVLR